MANIPPVQNLPPLSSISDPATRNYLQVLSNGWRVRNGETGDGKEKFLTIADLEGGISQTISSIAGGGGSIVSRPVGGGSALVAEAMKRFTDSVMNSKIWKDLSSRIKRVEDPAWFAGKFGAEIHEENIIRQTESEAFAQKLTTSIARLGNGTALAQQALTAVSNLEGVVASSVTTLQADVGEALTSAQESLSLSQTVDGKVEGAWSVKFDIDGYVVGAGLGVEGKGGSYSSTFLIKADRFAVATPAGDKIPFGADANGVYMNGQVYINAGGPTLTEAVSEFGISIIASSLQWRVNTAGVPLNSSITLTASLKGALTGNVTWTKSGAGTTPPAAGTTNTWVIQAADQTADTNVYTATLISGGITYTKSVTITRVSDGAKGEQGTAGQLGSLSGYGSAYGIAIAAWDDAIASRVIYNMLTGGTGTSGLVTTDHLMIGDTVTLGNGTDFAATRYWSGSSWMSPGVVIDGNLLVNGTVSANKVTAGSIITGQAANARVIIGDTTLLGSIKSPFHVSKVAAAANQTLISAANNKDASVSIWGSSTFVSGNAVSGTWHASDADTSAGRWNLIGILGAKQFGAAVAGNVYNNDASFGGYFRYFSTPSDSASPTVLAEVQLATSIGGITRAIVASGKVQLSGANSSLVLNNSEGSVGQYLTSAGPGLTPTWTTGSGGGSVTYAGLQAVMSPAQSSSLDLGATFRSTGTTAPASGSGVEMAYYSGSGYIIAGTRSSGSISAYSPLQIQGSSVTFNVTPVCPTPATATNSTTAATTAYVVSRIAQDAPTKTGSGASGSWGISSASVGGFKCFGGSGTADASGNFTASFGSSFSSSSSFGASAVSTTGCYCVITGVSSSSVTFQVQNRATGAAVGNAGIRWTAVGT